jgi:hypothetical protein
MPAKKTSKGSTTSKRVVVDENGKEYVLHGFGWGKDYPLDIDPRIDLTKPIWEQAQRLAAQDSRRRTKRAAA